MEISRHLFSRVCMLVVCMSAFLSSGALAQSDSGRAAVDTQYNTRISDDSSRLRLTDRTKEVSQGENTFEHTQSAYSPPEFAQCGQVQCGSCPNCLSSSQVGPSDAWTLPQPDVLQRMGIKVGGWLQQGITFNAHHSDDGFNGPVGTNDWDDEYQMNQLWLYLDRPADNGGSGFAWGGHFDIIYGSDWRFGINEGLETEINGFDYQDYGTVIPRMYLEFAYNKMSVKLGHIAGILDYEAVPSPLNPFYSHSYSYAYTVPQLVTGVLSEYKLTDRLVLQSGFHRGWFMFEDNNDTLDYMGGAKWTSPNERTKLSYGVSIGPQDAAGEQDRFVYSMVLEQKLFQNLQYVVVHNLGTEQNATRAGTTAEWYGINQYFLYALTPKLNTNLRVEWMRDDDGVRIAGPGNIDGVDAWAGRGFAGSFYNITAGLNWRPWGNLIVRPECRWDWYDGAEGPVGLPFDGGNEDSQFTVGMDAILTY
ncbi:MAG: outer membrane beta-barrel protein [Planctomycetota bacterium]